MTHRQPWASASQHSDPIDRLRDHARDLHILPEDLLEWIHCPSCASATWPSRSHVGPVVAEVHHTAQCPDYAIDGPLALYTTFSVDHAPIGHAWVLHVGPDDLGGDS
jgi:hypothetical protein